MKLVCDLLTVALGLFLAIWTPPVSAEQIVFSTGEFVQSEWSSHIGGVPPVNGSIAWTEASGGNPGGFRGVRLILDVNENAYNVQLWDLAVFTPATQGSIESVSASYDIKRVFNDHPLAIQVAKGIAVLQDGVIHRHLLGVSESTAWDPVSVDDLVPLFPGVDWTQGNQIGFGFYDSASAHLGIPFTIDGGYDNFRVEVNFVPEPSTLVLLSMGALALTIGWWRQRR